MSSFYLPIPLAVAAVLAAAVTAQTPVVTPAHFENVEAPFWYPHGIATTSATHRFLQIYDELQGPARTISAIAFRRDGSQATTAHSGGTMLVNVFVSTAATTAATPHATFDSNHGPDKVQVGRNVVIQVPPTPGGIGPRDWDLRIPFQPPFRHTGSGPLCVEVQVISNTNRVAILADGVQTESTNPPPITWTIGSGCIASTTQSREITLSIATGVNWSNGTSRMNLNGRYLPPNALVFVVFGFQNLSLGGVPLPFELPGSAGAPSGPCNIYSDIRLDLPQLTDATGALTSQVDVPIQPSAHGVNVYAQTLALDAGANPLGIVASNSVRVQYISPYGMSPVGIVYDQSGLAATGTIGANRGLITRFE